jgi:hypothetical protein
VGNEVHHEDRSEVDKVRAPMRGRENVPPRCERIKEKEKKEKKKNTLYTHPLHPSHAFHFSFLQ